MIEGEARLLANDPIGVHLAYTVVIDTVRHEVLPFECRARNDSLSNFHTTAASLAQARGFILNHE